MRTMYDAVTPANILKANPHPQLVAGYLNGKYAWKQSDWDLFPNAVHVGISVRAAYLVGHVLDVEIGDATPTESVGWVKARRAAGADPSVYCNTSTWPAVVAAFRAANVPLPHWWAAKYDGSTAFPSGAVAKQYLGDVAPGIDVSAVADYWPGVDTTTPNPNPGGVAASTSGVELMERITAPASKDTTSIRLLLPGSDNARIIIRPRLDAGGNAVNTVFLGHIFAWGSDKAGVGHDPMTGRAEDSFLHLNTHHQHGLPGAVWADLNYSSLDPFDIDILG